MSVLGPLDQDGDDPRKGIIVYRAPEFLASRPNWVHKNVKTIPPELGPPLPAKRVCLPPQGQKGGGEQPYSNDWTEILALYILCGISPSLIILYMNLPPTKVKIQTTFTILLSNSPWFNTFQIESKNRITVK
jgi:hypothetical protein